MTALYYVQDVALQVSFRFIAETEYHINPKDRKEKRRCPVPKNRYFRNAINKDSVMPITSEKSSAKIVSTQKNHFFASLCGYVRLDMLRFSGRLNHFALKAEIYISALISAFSELQKLQPLKLLRKVSYEK